MDNQELIIAPQSPEAIRRELADQFAELELIRPMRMSRYDAGQELTYEITGVNDGATATVRLEIDKFVGGGFAGQVYRVNLLDIDSNAGSPGGLEAGKKYAMKILVPPSKGSLAFRNIIYRIGFQGSFQLQVNPAAARAGAIWQKFIRIAAGDKFNDPNAVVDIHATFIDQTIGSCGELSEWIDGRVWDLEVDNHLDLLKQYFKGKQVDESKLGSPEYRAKRIFMADFVKLLHEIGAHEFARQYEWGTCKSQPNVLKRNNAGDGPGDGLTAVDFRAGLALLPFLPMSPGDFPLIAKGVARGSLVQFDRGNLKTLERYIESHKELFADMGPAFEELKAAEEIYRNSLPDITHNHVKLLYSRKLWSTICDSTITAANVRGITDDAFTASLRQNRFKALMFAAAGFIGALCFGGAAATFIWAYLNDAMSWPLGISLAMVAFIGPKLGRLLRATWGNARYRKHCGKILGSWSYALRASHGRFLEKLTSWHRDWRVSSRHTNTLSHSNWRLAGHELLAKLPVFLHRGLTDWRYVRKKLHYIFVRPAWLFFNPKAREHWLREMLVAGQKSRMLTDEDAAIIESQLSDPYIQKYLKSLAVHVCTLPVTQVVSVAIAIIWVWTHPEREGAWKEGLGIIAIFQVLPVSPGSLCRGLYVLYLVIKERNFKDYNIALFLGFFKYVGYLSFPIQMAYRYPALARFMAGHWATGAAHVVPVFGEHGAVLEHAVFSKFYNLPLTIRRRMTVITEHRKSLPIRGWHMLPIIALGIGAFCLSEWTYLKAWGSLPGIMSLWPVLVALPLLAGAAVSKWAGNATLTKRALYAMLTGLLTGLCAAAAHVWIRMPQGEDSVALVLKGMRDNSTWGVLVFALLAVIGAIIYEIKQPLPKSNN
ncbi:MAG: hypothetical protein HN350_14270 [Phycisphaerales bacterium]|nr:hypothetical protein [Phycisphaerales bacterium]